MFLRGLKPAYAKLGQDAARDGLWTSTEQVFAKSMTFETSKAAIMSVV